MDKQKNDVFKCVKYMNRLFSKNTSIVASYRVKDAQHH